MCDADKHLMRQQDMRAQVVAAMTALSSKRKRTLRERAERSYFASARMFGAYTRDEYVYAWLSGYRAGSRKR